MQWFRRPFILPLVTGFVAAAAVVVWLVTTSVQPVHKRVPGADEAPRGVSQGAPVPQERGKLTKGTGVPSSLPGSWPQFRGRDHDGISKETMQLARRWSKDGPPRLWDCELGEGYAGAAVHRGRVYLLDYDHKQEADVIRCLSLADGKEIWRFSYSVKVKRNHGMSRTVPAVTDDVVVTLGPKCHVTCVDADSGRLKWALDLVQQYGTHVPEWYAGQCPLLDGDRVILAPGGRVLMMAVELLTGKILWETPNPKAWDMTHASIAPMEVAGQRIYVYPAKRGVVGVSADDGRLLWETTAWRIGIATVPTPVPVGDSRIFFSGGYNAGSLMLELTPTGNGFMPKVLYRLKPSIFGAAQQTPIFYANHLFGVRPNGELVCLTLDGKVKWASGAKYKFGLGPFMIADGLLLALNDDGLLTMAEASPEAFKPLAQAKVLTGHEAWAPMALAGGRLLVRDLTRMVCIDLRG